MRRGCLYRQGLGMGMPKTPRCPYHCIKHQTKRRGKTRFYKINHRLLRYRKKEKNQHQLLTKLPTKQEELYNHLENIRDAPLENLRGWWQKYKKKYSRKGKLNEKNSCKPINPKKYSCYSLKKIRTRNLITKKKFLRLENPAPPFPNFSNGPSLRSVRCKDGNILTRNILIEVHIDGKI